jgi:salicylate hydroxylase
VAAITLLGNYKEKFGYHTLAVGRCNLHRILLATDLSEDRGEVPCKLVTSYRTVNMDAKLGQITFENGEVFTVDLVIAAGDTHLRIRTAIGIILLYKFHLTRTHVISKCKDTELGLGEIGSNNSIEFWSRPGTEKIIIGFNYRGKDLCICYFFP